MLRLRVACVILITQLPPPVQGPINDWQAEKVDITLSIAREFINKVRKALVEKNIPLDQGHRDFRWICELRTSKERPVREVDENWP